MDDKLREYNKSYYQKNRERLLRRQLGPDRKMRSKYVLKWAMLDDEAKLVHAFEFSGWDIGKKRYRHYYNQLRKGGV